MQDAWLRERAGTMQDARNNGTRAEGRGGYGTRDNGTTIQGTRNNGARAEESASLFLIFFFFLKRRCAMSVSRPTPYPVLLRVPRSALHRCAFRNAPKFNQNGTRTDDARCTMHDARCTMQDARCTMHDARCTMHDARCKMHDARCTMHDARCKMHAKSPRVWVRCAFRETRGKRSIVPRSKGHETRPQTARNTHRFNKLQCYTPPAPMPQVQTVKTAKKHGKKTIKHAKKAENRPATPPA